MKRLAILIFLMCLFTGCSSAEEDEQPTAGVSTADRERFTKLVDDTLYETYWRYSAESLEFYQGTVPEQNQENEAVFAANTEEGYTLSQNAGKSAAVATVDLLHYNGDAAGRAYFYFIRGDIVGVYYSGSYKSDNHSLKERNLFLADGGFTKYETGAIASGSFVNQKTQFPSDGFESMSYNNRGQALLASLELGNIVIYRHNQSFFKFHTLSISNGKLEATNAVFLNSERENGLAVLICTAPEENTLSEGAHTNVASVRLDFYNKDFRKTEEMPLTSENYSCVAQDGEQLVLANSEILEYYDYTENGYEKVKQYFLDHGVLAFHVTDLDGDGVNEYILTDEQDLYLYHKTDGGFVKLWSTHLGIQSLSGNIYSGDLNQDGVKEIYISDITGTMIRYILTPSGLRSSNSDLEYGDRIYPFDINRDGLDDYIRLNNVEDLQSDLYTAQPQEGES